MGRQFKTPASWEELKLGTRIYVSDDSPFGLHESRWVSKGTPILAQVVSPLVQGAHLLVMLGENARGSFLLHQSLAATNNVVRKLIEGSNPGSSRFFWVCAFDAVRLYDPTYLSETTAFGNHTCKCGAMNKDVAASSVINGKYVCYSCRVIMPREHAA